MNLFATRLMVDVKYDGMPYQANDLFLIDPVNLTGQHCHLNQLLARGPELAEGVLRELRAGITVIATPGITIRDVELMLLPRAASAQPCGRPLPSPRLHLVR